MQHTKIEWVKNPDGSQGFTWNPITGCLNGCEYCYARRLANGRLKQRYLANERIAGINPHESVPYIPAGMRELELRNPFYPRFWEDRFYKMPMYGKPKGIFVCDMSDLFGIGIPEEWTRMILTRIKMSEGHRFYLLTKQPQNLTKFSPFPENCWVGVTATNAKMAEEAGFWLWEVKSKVKFISFEPLLEQIPVRFADYIGEGVEGIKWIIIGAQTGPYKPPKIEWVQEIVDAADKAGVAVFLKDNLEASSEIEGYYPFYCDATGFPLHHLRQEMPGKKPTLNKPRLSSFEIEEVK